MSFLRLKFYPIALALLAACGGDDNRDKADTADTEETDPGSSSDPTSGETSDTGLSMSTSVGEASTGESDGSTDESASGSDETGETGDSGDNTRPPSWDNLCNARDDLFESCAQFCGSGGETCAENGCDGGSVVGFAVSAGQPLPDWDCQNGNAGSIIPDACETPFTELDAGLAYFRCCCERT